MRSVVWSEQLADRIWSLAHSEATGVRHVVSTRASSRVELARHLDHRFNLRATLTIATRGEQSVPHIGNVEVITDHDDPLSTPLEGVVES